VFRNKEPLFCAPLCAYVCLTCQLQQTLTWICSDFVTNPDEQRKSRHHGVLFCRFLVGSSWEMGVSMG
jgi:hypothetical protein